MRLGINLPTRRADGRAPNAKEIMERARLIEETGFDGIWLAEQVARGDGTSPDTLQWLTAAACATQRIELGTAVLQLPLRPPVELAQRLMTLQALSGGRFTAGVGAGSSAKDFVAVGLDFEQRFKLLREGAATIKRLLNDETVDGKAINPWPNVRGGPPIVIGAWGSGRWVERAAREYDGWMASGRSSSFRVISEGIKRYREAGGTGRKLVASVTVNLRAPYALLDPDASFNLNCPPQEASERLARLAELGFDDVLCSPASGAGGAWPPEAYLREIRGLLPRDTRPATA